jgi:hypothetical protein
VALLGQDAGEVVKAPGGERVVDAQAGRIRAYFRPSAGSCCSLCSWAGSAAMTTTTIDGLVSEQLW